MADNPSLFFITPAPEAHVMPHDEHPAVKELAACVKVVEAAVRRWIMLGDLRVIDIGTRLRIADADLDALLLQHQGAPRWWRPAPNGHAPEGEFSCR